jgi:hypothetical protein
MAELLNGDPNFGTREEDWLDLDVDSSTEEGADAIRRSEACFFASLDRSIQN